MSIINYGVSKHYAGSKLSDHCTLGYLFQRVLNLDNVFFLILVDEGSEDPFTPIRGPSSAQP